MEESENHYKEKNFNKTNEFIKKEEDKNLFIRKCFTNR